MTDSRAEQMQRCNEMSDRLQEIRMLGLSVEKDREDADDGDRGAGNAPFRTAPAA